MRKSRFTEEQIIKALKEHAAGLSADVSRKHDIRDVTAGFGGEGEVQYTDAKNFARKLEAVFLECHRVLKDDGLLIFTYHHSREEGWKLVREAVLGAPVSYYQLSPGQVRDVGCCTQIAGKIADSIR